ncbi:hypothetical protein PY254_06155 [Rhodanobacter sp. AS-Z3]|uniref:hypothetical protein n=1 Tax=Rhodanobacter sp. AS-Z3 TaxID=3031330 RepID=UPI002478BAC7|nr:hypothetical protein [Rhodanobacter sp. AS-Z3]WEN16248.1 hypothetical protein PY254_06155 [Rhodanobacter sp. AS-Z3]
MSTELLINTRSMQQEGDAGMVLQQPTPHRYIGDLKIHANCTTAFDLTAEKQTAGIQARRFPSLGPTPSR